jgi:DNA-binding IclR family transcriptional regulator
VILRRKIRGEFLTLAPQTAIEERRRGAAPTVRNIPPRGRRGPEQSGPVKKAKSEYSIQTVVNAFGVLEAFATEEELGVSELSRTLRLHKNNVFRILATLEAIGYIEQRDGGRYRLGTRCLALARSFRCAGGDLLRRARCVLADLARETGEAAHLAVLREHEVVHLDGADGRHALRVASRVGQRLPAHCTALGKVLLACAGEDALRAFDAWLEDGGGLAARTAHTLVDRDKLIEHLRGVSVQRFALDLEEWERGVGCAAAPVFDESGGVVAALSVSGPTSRVDADALLGPLGRAVTRAAERLSGELGYSA